MWSGNNSWYDYNFSMSGVPIGLQIFAFIFVAIGILICLALLVLQIIGMAKTFQKVKLPTWGAIVPFYNIFLLIKMTGLELWWFPVFLIACGAGNGTWAIGLLMAFGINYKIAKSFNKTIGFALGLTFLTPIFWMILGYSKDKYVGPAGPYVFKPIAKPTKDSAK